MMLAKTGTRIVLQSTSRLNEAHKVPLCPEYKNLSCNNLQVCISMKMKTFRPFLSFDTHAIRSRKRPELYFEVERKTHLAAQQ